MFLNFLSCLLTAINVLNVLIHSRCELPISPKPVSSYGTDFVRDA